jgi:hypothetical protein
VGGVSEMFLPDDRVERVKLRRGFIRQAIKHGYDIVPMFHFGQSRLFRYRFPTVHRWTIIKGPIHPHTNPPTAAQA